MELKELAAEVRNRRELPSPERCTEIRTRAGVSQARLAQVVGVSAQAIAHWEHGSRKPRGVLLDRYLAALKVIEDASA